MRRLTLLSACIFLAGCLPLDADPHKAFLFQYGTLVVGHDIRVKYSRGIPPHAQLENGLIETTSKFPNKNCTVHYQYDPKTFIVKSWRWEGDECVAAF